MKKASKKVARPWSKTMKEEVNMKVAWLLFILALNLPSSFAVKYLGQIFCNDTLSDDGSKCNDPSGGGACNWKSHKNNK